jgi:hypothetical protein
MYKSDKCIGDFFIDDDINKRRRGVSLTGKKKKVKTTKQ